MRNSDSSFMRLFADCLERKGVSGILRLMDWLQNRLQFSAGVVVSIRPVRPAPEIFSVINHSYDRAWVSVYQRENYISLDPVVKAALLNQSPIEWVTGAVDGDSALHRFWEGARDHGLHSGIAYVTKSRRPVLISVANAPRRRVTPEVVAALRAVGAASAEVLPAEADEETPVLTEREREVLRWLAAGKNNYEIGVITGLSESTVKFHLANIYTKMNASNRYHAVAKAVRLDLV